MTRAFRSSIALAGAALVVLAATACGSEDRGSATPAADPGGDGELLVAAASSLTDAFGVIETDFEDAHPEVDVVITFDASSTLAAQIREGAPVDVFVSADEATMAGLVDEDLVAGGPLVARNELVIVVPPGNPAGVEELADLVDLDVVALCAEDAPCGRFAAATLEAADVTLDEGSVSRAQNARATLGAVTDGDADAAIVYVTDAFSAGDAAERIEIPDDVGSQAAYPIGAVVASGKQALADAFIAFVTGADGRAALAAEGFLLP